MIILGANQNERQHHIAKRLINDLPEYIYNMWNISNEIEHS